MREDIRNIVRNRYSPVSIGCPKAVEVTGPYKNPIHGSSRSGRSDVGGSGYGGGYGGRGRRGGSSGDGGGGGGRYGGSGGSGDCYKLEALCISLGSVPTMVTNFDKGVN
ncbi:hypothetical protein CXB51_018353 [Gossypium anomalum]|uniref:Uncharacterized protein n=1 Tax=Gossypium anomalum TaxID=47600 RepID=A0A8J5ZGJ0_9ROSI|nr:hypothetical protein CXB51_018353 [Gossypium anomalum]